MSLEQLQREFDRAMRDGRDDEAQRLAIELAPHYEARVDAEDDRHPSPIPQWGTEV